MRIITGTGIKDGRKTKQQEVKSGKHILHPPPPPPPPPPLLLGVYPGMRPVDSYELVSCLTVTGFPVWASIISIGIVCTFYTTIVSE